MIGIQEEPMQDQLMTDPGRSSTCGEAPGRRERKKQATRQALHEAAADLVETTGLAQVTIEAITDRVDVAPRTFFNHYTSKEDAVLGPRADPHLVDGVLRRELAGGADIVSALETALIDHLVPPGGSLPGLQRRMRLLRREPLLLATAIAHAEVLCVELTATVADHIGADSHHDLYPAAVVQVMMSTTRAAMARWAQDPCHPIAALVGEAVALLRNGFSDPGRPPKR